MLKIWPIYAQDMAKIYQHILNIWPKYGQGIPKMLSSGALQKWDKMSKNDVSSRPLGYSDTFLMGFMM